MAYMVLLWVLAGRYLPVFCLEADQSIKVFRSPHDSQLQHLVVDTQLGSGHVYIGAVDHVYHLSTNLRLLQDLKTGPVNDSVDCPVIRECDSSIQLRPTSNYNKGLAISSKLSKLIVCGSVRQGACHLVNIGNISSTNGASPSRKKGLVANDEGSSSVIFVGPGPPQDGGSKDVLYVASTYTGKGSFRDEVPAVASRRLEPGEEMFNYVGRSVHSSSSIQVEITKRQFFKITYVAGFISSKYAYFITRQPEYRHTSVPSQMAGPMLSKLIRICQSDVNYYSYTEVPLKCKTSRAGEPSMDYELVQAAYVTKPGYDLALRLNITTEDDVLFAVFSSGEGPRKRRHAKNHALCIYSMKYVESVFLQNIKECAKGNMMRGLDFFRWGRKCLRVEFSDEELACGNEVNYPLGGSIPIEAQPAITNNSIRVGAIAATSIHQHTVVFMGTDDGHLRQATVEEPDKARVYGEVSIESGQAILGDMHFDISGRFLYAMTSKSVTKVNLAQCEQYRTCTECLDASNPYCDWCSQQKKCSEKDKL